MVFAVAAVNNNLCSRLLGNGFHHSVKIPVCNENLRHEIAKRDKGIDELKAKMQKMQEQHGKQIRNLQGR